MLSTENRYSSEPLETFWEGSEMSWRSFEQSEGARHFLQSNSIRAVGKGLALLAVSVSLDMESYSGVSQEIAMMIATELCTRDMQE